MKYLNRQYYVEVKDHRYLIHPTPNRYVGIKPHDTLSSMV